MASLHYQRADSGICHYTDKNTFSLHGTALQQRKSCPRTTALQCSSRLAKSSERGTCSVGLLRTVPNTQNERLLFGTARREIMTFIQPATRQCHVILLSSKLHQTLLSCKHNIFHCNTRMPPYSQVCHHISRSTPTSLLITSWAGDSPSFSRWSKQTFLVFFL